MNDLILSQLSSLKSILLAIFVLLVFIAFYMLIALLRMYQNLRVEVPLKTRERFMSQAYVLEDKGEYTLLAALAQMRIQNYPKDPNAYWYLALAKYRQKDWAAALTALKHIQRIDACWNKLTVEQYIEDSKSHLNGPQKTLT